MLFSQIPTGFPSFVGQKHDAAERLLIPQPRHTRKRSDRVLPAEKTLPGSLQVRKSENSVVGAVILRAHLPVAAGICTSRGLFR